MKLWHKPAEKPRKGTLYVLLETNIKQFYLLYSDGYPYGIDNKIKKWCYLSNLLKLEKENKKLKMKIKELTK